jgi:hypothetical protein
MLAGCGAAPPDQVNTLDMRLNAVDMRLDSALSSEVAYQRIVAASRICYLRGNPTVEADFLPESKEGWLRYATGNLAGNPSAIDVAKVDIKPAASGSTIYITLRRVDSEFATAIPAWLRGEIVPCPSL